LVLVLRIWSCLHHCPISFRVLPSPSLFPYLLSPSLPLIQLWSLGEHCKLPRRSPGRSPGRQRIIDNFDSRIHVYGDNRCSNPTCNINIDIYYKLPSIHRPAQNSLPAGGQVPLTDRMGPWQYCPLDPPVGEPCLFGALLCNARPFSRRFLRTRIRISKHERAGSLCLDVRVPNGKRSNKRIGLIHQGSSLKTRCRLDRPKMYTRPVRSI